MMGRLRAGLLGAVVLGIALLLLLPLDLSRTTSLQGKLYAASEWKLGHAGRGVLVASLSDRSRGVSSPYLIQSVERGDVAEFALNPLLQLGARVERGDTVGELRSTAADRELAEAEGLLEVAIAQAETFSQGAKQTQISEVRRQLEQAESLLALQERIVARLRTLRDNGAISTDEVEREEIGVVSLKGQLQVFNARIDDLRAGARTSERLVAASQISGLRARLLALQHQRDRRTILFPIGGVVVPPRSDSVLVRVVNPASWIAVVPVPLGLADQIRVGQELDVAVRSEQLSCTVAHLGTTVESLRGAPVLLSTCELHTSPSAPLDGLLVQLGLDSPPVTLQEAALKFLRGLFGWRNGGGDASRG